MLWTFYKNHRSHGFWTRNSTTILCIWIIVHCQGDERCLSPSIPFVQLSRCSSPINWRRKFRLERWTVEHCLDQCLSSIFKLQLTLRCIFDRQLSVCTQKETNFPQVITFKWVITVIFHILLCFILFHFWYFLNNIFNWFHDPLMVLKTEKSLVRISWKWE